MVFGLRRLMDDEENGENEEEDESEWVAEIADGCCEACGFGVLSGVKPATAAAVR